MTVIKNRDIIDKRFSHIARILSQYSAETAKVKITNEVAKSGDPTLVVLEGNRSVYIHSKYNPVEEARRLITQYGDISKRHVVFFGVGLGYHIDFFVNTYPVTSFSIFEPSIDVLYQSLHCKNFDFLKSNYLENFQVGINKVVIHDLLSSLANKIDKGLTLIVLPNYEKAFHSDASEFAKHFSRLLEVKKSNLFTNLKYEERWTINSVVNFITTIQTPNIFHDIDRGCFRNKPAMIVAAGPSLNEEIENLRTIKKRGLAYIFAVGSAINTLIHNGIYPDAACSYDPQEITQITFKQLKEKGITSIPLIYGSTVGYETVATYPGAKAHMITNQDALGNTFLRRTDGKAINIVQDAPSVAVITFQLLARLQCNPIILVGQNLAYRNEQKYAAGIAYMKQQVSEKEINNAIHVKDVHGNPILSNQTFNLMRKSLEEYISLVDSRVINTTVDGAKIAGTEFIPLYKVIESILVEDNVVMQFEFEQSTNLYDRAFLRSKLDLIQEEYSLFVRDIGEMKKSLDKLRTATDYRDINKLSTILVKVEQLLFQLFRNSFYRTFLLLMNRVRIEWLVNQIEQIRSSSDLIYRANELLAELNKFMIKTNDDFKKITPHYQKMYQEVIKFLDRGGILTS